MAKVRVKLFGVLRVDTHLANEQIEADRLADIFELLNRKVDENYEERLKENARLEHPDLLSYKDALVYVNGERCTKKNKVLQDGDEIWLLSPASGG